MSSVGLATALAYAVPASAPTSEVGGSGAFRFVAERAAAHPNGHDSAPVPSVERIVPHRRGTAERSRKALWLGAAVLVAALAAITTVLFRGGSANTRGHFNPGAQPHGRAGQGPHHAGDSDNIVADARGVARVNAHVRGVTLGGGAANDIAGRAIIVHAAADDYATQPTGNAGARVACGVITVVR